MRTVILSLLVGLVLAAVLVRGGHPAAAQETATPAPAPQTWLPVDAFYTPPAEVPAEPGALLRSEPLTNRLLPEGARAWRILYTTTFPDGSPATAVATVLAPIDPPPGPRPVITWEHGTVGILQKCMPSLVSAPFEGVPGPRSGRRRGLGAGRHRLRAQPAGRPPLPHWRG